MKAIIYQFILISTQLIFMVLSEPNLCKKPQIDSISYLADSKMIFFTSNGWYWLVKEDEMPPPRGRGKRMKDSFKGEASFYLNLLDCGRGEREVMALQLYSNGMHVKSFDLRDNEWKTDRLVETETLIKPAYVDWSKRVNAMFDIDKTNVVVIQGEHYSTVQFAGVCQNRGMFSNPYGPHNAKHDFNTDKKIDATMYKNGQLFVFTGKEYFIITNLQKMPNGQYKNGGRTQSHPIAQHFFKYPAGNCPTFPDEGGISTLIIILIVLFIVIAIIVVAVVFIAYRRKQGANQLAAKKGAKGAAKPVFNPSKDKQLPKPPKAAKTQTTPTDTKNKAELTEKSTRSLKL